MRNNTYFFAIATLVLTGIAGSSPAFGQASESLGHCQQTVGESHLAAMQDGFWLYLLRKGKSVRCGHCRQGGIS